MMATQPMVSILMPFKNTGVFLEECIRSIQEQTYTNWELIAVNDHSTDDSALRLQDMAVSDPRITVLLNPGKGIIPALREAFEASSGNLLTRMDSDDIMPAAKLEHMVSDLRQFGKRHISLGLVRYFSDRGISDGYKKYEQWLNKLSKSGSNFTEIYKECSIPSPCWMVYREDLIEAGAFFPDRYPEDYDLTFRFYALGLRCIPSMNVLHYWRDYGARTSRNHEHYAMNYFLDLKLDHFLNLDFQNSRPLLLWGAGYKGKSLARQLLHHGLEFRWVCDNPNKIGKKIYGVPMEHFSVIRNISQPQSIISVAKRGAQKQIRTTLMDLGQKPMKDFFFFC